LRMFLMGLMGNLGDMGVMGAEIRKIISGQKKLA